MELTTLNTLIGGFLIFIISVGISLLYTSFNPKIFSKRNRRLFEMGRLFSLFGYITTFIWAFFTSDLDYYLLFFFMILTSHTIGFFTRGVAIENEKHDLMMKAVRIGNNFLKEKKETKK